MGKRENPSNGRGNSCKLSKVIWGCSFSRFVAQKREKEPPCPTLTPKPTSSTTSRHPSGRRPRLHTLCRNPRGHHPDRQHAIDHRRIRHMGLRQDFNHEDGEEAIAEEIYCSMVRCLEIRQGRNLMACSSFTGAFRD